MMKRIAKYTTLSAIGVLVLLSGVLVFNTVRVASPSGAVVERTSLPVLSQREVTERVDRLAEAIRYRTISTPDTAQWDPAPFEAFRSYLESAFPRVHARLNRTDLARHTVLYEWTGTRPELGPVVLMAHQDVVPVAAESEGDWTRPAFGGEIADGHVWGRGAVDDKGSLMAILESVEALLAEGYRPARTVVLVFGEDEETRGRGAAAAAAHLDAEGITPWLVLDEGGLILEDGPLPVSRPVALVGIAEKGYASIELEVRADGGHASMPPRETAVSILAGALDRLQRTKFEPRPESGADLLFDRLTPHMTGAERVIFANRWLFGPLITRTLSADPSTYATLHTTMAPTMLRGSPRDNVLAREAGAVINFRIIPGETVALVVERVREAIDDERVAIRVWEAGRAEPSPLSPTADSQWGLLDHTIRRVFPEAIVAPFLVVAQTDARFMTRVSQHVYRFAPLRMTLDGLQGIHGTDERIAVEDYARMMAFYRELLLTAAQPWN